MIFIEKLKTSNTRPQIGLVDLLHKNNTNCQNMLGIYPATHLLKSYIESQLDHISIGAKFGVEGIDINSLLVNKPDIIVETTAREIKKLPKAKLSQLLQEHTIILTDLEEGGAFYGHMDDCLVTYLHALKIIPKKIISITSGFDQQSNTDLNIQCVYIPAWPLFATLSNEFYIKLVFDREFNSKQKSIIQSSDKKFGLFPNKKPRFHRVNLLAELSHRGILDHFDWSLVYSKEPLGDENDFGNFIKSPNNFRFNTTIEEFKNSKIEKFLSNYSFPKIFTDSKHNTFGDSIGPAESWFGKYNYYISAETYVHPEPISFGRLGFLTEKTFKSLCIGAHPFIMGVPGSEQQLRNLGFKIYDFGYDHLSSNDRTDAICKTLEKLVTQPMSEEILENRIYNFSLITSPEFLAGLVTRPLNNFFNLRTQQN